MGMQCPTETGGIKGHETNGFVFAASITSQMLNAHMGSKLDDFQFVYERNIHGSEDVFGQFPQLRPWRTMINLIVAGTKIVVRSAAATSCASGQSAPITFGDVRGGRTPCAGSPRARASTRC